MTVKSRLHRLLNPRTVAIFGGDDASVVIHQCRRSGFDGDIWPVNPGRSEMQGIPCFGSIADLPAVPDAGFVATPPKVSVEIIAELAKRGTAGAVCYASGFAETGGDGLELQQQLVSAAEGLALIGPNCYGYLNYFDGIALWPDEHGGKRVDKGVAIVLQSGNIGINLTMQARGLDIGYVISVGNKCALGLNDYIDVLVDDPRVTAIGLHVEGIDDVAAFSESAIRALKKRVPIIVLKTGRSDKGAEVVMSHTASLAGSDRLYSAYFERLGIGRCDTIEQFLETLKFVSIAGTLNDNTIASMSCSGGEASLVADYASDLGLDMPTLGEESESRLRSIVGPNVNVANPLDYHTYIWPDYDAMHGCFAAMLENGNACTMLVLDYPVGEGTSTEHWEVAERALIDAVARTGQRAVIVSTLPETLPRAARDRLKAAGIAPMQGLDSCLRAIATAAHIGRKQAVADTVLRVARPSDPVGTGFNLDEARSKELLREFGIAVPEGRICRADAAAACAGELTYPLVLKGVSSELVHKSEQNAVVIDLRDEAAVVAAAEQLGARYDSLLIEEFVHPVVAEIIVGVSRDATFGLYLMIGSGGTLVELVGDTAMLLLPASRVDIVGAIESLKVAKLLHGFRNRESADIDAVVDAIEGIIEFAMTHYDLLLELDVNPLAVTADSAVAVDAYIRMLGKPAGATK